MNRLARIRNRKEQPDPGWISPFFLILSIVSYAGLVFPLGVSFSQGDLQHGWIFVTSALCTPIFTYLYHRTSNTRLLEEIAEELYGHE
jgi:hypothetical protein